jgi:polysaccharide pyruvyl transferase WcaK-like protein
MYAASAEPAIETIPASGGIAVLGHYGQLNLGDESLTAAVIAGVRAIRPDARIVGISLNPEDTARRHGVESFALRRDVSRTPTRPPRAPVTSVHGEGARGPSLRRLARRVPGLVGTVRGLASIPARLTAFASEVAALGRAWRALAGIDLVIVAGSNQLLDQMGGAFGFPYTLLKWALLARLRGARVVLLSVGAGPLEGWLARRFVLWTLRLSDYLSVRDEGSARLVREIGWRGAAPVLPDLAFGLEFGRAEARAPRTAAPLTVAMNLMPVHDPRWWPEARADVGERYVAAMAGFVGRLLEQGHRVELFGTQPADEWVAEDLMARIARGPETALSLVTVRTLEDLARVMRHADVVVATRFHGILLALRMARPVLGVCYYRKSRELMRAVGLERYAFDLDRVTATQLEEAFAALVAESSHVERQVLAALPARAEALAEQFRTVLTPSAPDAVRA